jgi:hypothetical protein
MYVFIYIIFQILFEVYIMVFDNDLQWIIIPEQIV